MTEEILEVKPLTSEAFAHFGQVIQKKDRFLEEINYGYTHKYADLAQVDISDASGRPGIHLFSSRPVSLPISIKILERHPLGSQAFVPLHQQPFLVVVAPAGEVPEAGDVKAFLSNGSQGINIAKGVWHHYQITLGEPGEYLVVDRVGPGENFEECRLEKALTINSLPVLTG
jgi:ureidoglycolate lyase